MNILFILYFALIISFVGSILFTIKLIINIMILFFCKLINLIKYIYCNIIKKMIYLLLKGVQKIWQMKKKKKKMSNW